MVKVRGLLKTLGLVVVRISGFMSFTLSSGRQKNARNLFKRHVGTRSSITNLTFPFLAGLDSLLRLDDRGAGRQRRSPQVRLLPKKVMKTRGV